MPNAQEPHKSTQAVLAEFDSPSIQSYDVLKGAVRVFRKQLHRVSGQVARYQELIGDATIDEEHEGIAQKYHGLDSTCRAVQAKHDKVAEVLMGLLNAGRGLDRECEELRAEVKRVREGRDSVEAPRG